MLSLTAIIRAKAGQEGTVERALLDMARHVAANESGTVGYFVTRSDQDPTVFLTYERFNDRAAMELHNGSAALDAFVAATKDALAGPIEIHTGQEVAAGAG
jgi:quinol monooxygenase YgiN